MAKVEEARAYVRDHAAGVRESGIRIALGTDSMHGLFGYEMQWLVEHGWSAREALLAATRNGGLLIEDPTAGVLAPRSRADFVALRRDPLTDITAVFDVAAVYRDGRVAIETPVAAA
jgi:imidazolonepropionase-like amidohydrolase